MNSESFRSSGVSVLFTCLACGAEVRFPRGEAAHVVASPATTLEQRGVQRLTAYLDRVLGQPTVVQPDLAGADSNQMSNVSSSFRCRFRPKR
jgi:hypothetical protein